MMNQTVSFELLEMVSLSADGLQAEGVGLQSS